MLKTADADHTVERFIFKAEILRKAVHIPRSRPVQLLRCPEGLRVPLQTIRQLKVPGETFCPEAVAAADIEQCAGRGLLDTLAKQGKLAIAIERAVTADCGVHAFHDAHFDLVQCWTLSALSTANTTVQSSEFVLELPVACCDPNSTCDFCRMDSKFRRLTANRNAITNSNSTEIFQSG